MLDRADIGLLALVALILLCSRAYSHWTIRKHKALAQRYKLYGARDNFVYLVAVDKLSEDDLIFRTFYKAANYYIGAIDRITLSNFVAAMVDARKKGFDPADTKTVDEIATAVHRNKDQEVTSAVVEFFGAVMSILHENSLVLQTFFKFRALRRLLHAFAEITRKVNKESTHRRAYWFYQDYARAQAQI
jgi:hypothetical protein